MERERSCAVLELSRDRETPFWGGELLGPGLPEWSGNLLPALPHPIAHPAVLGQSRGGSVWGSSPGGWAGSHTTAASRVHSRGLASLLQSCQ